MSRFHRAALLLSTIAVVSTMPAAHAETAAKAQPDEPAVAPAWWA